MKQLIEEQKQKDTAKILDILVWQKAITDEGINYRGEKDWALNKILDWHKQSLKQFIDELIGREEKEIEKARIVVRGAKTFSKVVPQAFILAKDDILAHLKKLKEELN